MTDVKPCEIWTGHKTQLGYGQVHRKVDGKWTNIYVHRLVCEFFHGAPPPGKPFAMHSCDNPSCYEPSHLSWGSPNDNVQDAKRKGRVPNGEGHWNARLTAGQVQEIRRRKAGGANRRDLAREFSLSVSYVTKLCRKGWRSADAH